MAKMLEPQIMHNGKEISEISNKIACLKISVKKRAIKLKLQLENVNSNAKTQELKTIEHETTMVELDKQIVEYENKMGDLIIENYALRNNERQKGLRFRG